MKKLKLFMQDQDGAVTIDFTVVTAAIVVLAIVVGSILLTAGTDAAVALAQSIVDYLHS